MILTKLWEYGRSLEERIKKLEARTQQAEGAAREAAEDESPRGQAG